MKLTPVILSIRKHLGPDFVKPANRKYRPADAVASWGCCYVAVEALYYLGAREEGFVPAYIYMGDLKNCIFASPD
jgi:hypothetical protein